MQQINRDFDRPCRPKIRQHRDILEKLMRKDIRGEAAENQDVGRWGREREGREGVVKKKSTTGHEPFPPSSLGFRQDAGG